eukprot:4460-Heterococcus_DN1.PRE.5
MDNGRLLRARKRAALAEKSYLSNELAQNFWQRLASSEDHQLQQLRSCFLKHLNGDPQLIIDKYDEFSSSPLHEPQTMIDDTLVINADMLASSTVSFLESVCKLEVRPIQYKIVYNSALSEEETAVHKTIP